MVYAAATDTQVVLHLKQEARKKRLEDMIGAEYITDVRPGKLVVVDKKGMTSTAVADSTEQAKSIFEFICFSRPNSRVFEENVDEMSRQPGVELAKSRPVEADLVIAITDSSNASALGFSEDAGMQFEQEFIRNHYVGRTFYHPERSTRDAKACGKLNPVMGVRRGKRAAVVDNSIVRDLTMKKLGYMLKHAGARDARLRLCSPPVRFLCLNGDFKVPHSTTPQASILENGSAQN